MARVPEYFRNQLASEQTGVPPPDQSGVIIAQAAKGFSDTVFRGVLTLEAQQNKVLNASKSAKILGNFGSDLLKTTDSLKTEFSSDPSKMPAQEQERYSQLKNQYLDGIDNPTLRRNVSLRIDNQLANTKIENTAWRLKQQRLVIQQNYIDAMNSSARDLTRPEVTYQDLLNKISDFQSLRGELNAAFGGPKNADAFITSGVNAFTKAYVLGQIENKNVLGTLNRLDNGDFNPFLTIDGKKELRKSLISAEKGKLKNDRIREVANGVADFGDMAKNIDKLSIPDLEEKITQLSFDVGSDPKNPNNDLRRKQINTLENLRQIKIEGVAATAADDVVVKGELVSRWQRIVKKKDNKPNTLKGTFEEALNLQNDLSKAFYDGNISQKTFTSYSTLLQSAIQGETNLAMEKGLIINRAGRGFNPGITDTKEPGVKKALNDLFGNLNVEGKGSEFIVDALDSYIAQLQERTIEGGGGEALISTATHDEMVRRARFTANLKAQGLPVYIKPGDFVDTPFGALPVQMNENGDPVVDVPVKNTNSGVFVD